MATIKKNIDKVLADMRAAGKIQDVKGKGTAGEIAALYVVLERQRRMGGLVYQSFTYPYQKNSEGVTYTGNIKLSNGGQYISIEKGRNGEDLKDEIDILFVTPYRVFVIEVKSYHASLRVFNDWVEKKGDFVDKSPVAQAEKHARHLYHAIQDVLPDGRPEYVIPIVCFVDRCTLTDERRDESIEYLPCCVLNNLKATIVSKHTPLKYNIDLKAMKSKLKQVCTSTEREFV